MFFSPSHAPIIGDLDERRRPRLQVELLVNTATHLLIAIVDTGCEDALVISDYDEAVGYGLRFALARGAPRHDRFFADGRFGVFVESRATINWFGDQIIRILAPDPQQPLGPLPPLAPGIPRILLGLPLLDRCTLKVRFEPGSGTVVIEPPADGR